METSNQEKPPAPRPFARIAEYLKSRTEDINLDTLKRIGIATGRAGTKLVLAGSLLTLAIAANHARTRYETSAEGAGFERQYVHEDQDTTDILNFLTGRSPFPERLRPQVDRQWVRLAYEMSEVPVPENVDSMSHQEAHDAILALNQLLVGSNFSDEDAELILTSDTQQIQYDPDMYEAVWEIHGRYGNPRIRFASGDIDITARAMGYLSGPGRSFYDPVTNTLYLNPALLRSAFFAEMAHAKQFHEQPLRSNARGALALVETISSAIVHLEDFQSSYQRQYHRPGSLENEAHEEREGQMLEEFGERYNASRQRNGRPPLGSGENSE